MKTKSGRIISKIGIGSYGVGGRGHRDMSITEKKEDHVYISALIYTLNKKINFTEISLGYGHGKALSLFKQALDKSSVKREDVFITHSFYPRDLTSFEEINQDVKQFYEVMETDYADSTLVTQSLILKFGESKIYSFLHNLLKIKKTRFVSLSNASPKWIKKFKEEFGDKFVAHEGHLSFEIRALQDKGVFKLCDGLNIKNIIWRPLRRNMTNGQNWSLLSELERKYKKTKNQIILNWICWLGFYPMVMSTSKKHIDENIDAIDFKMSDADYKKISDFRPPDYNPPKVDWEGMEIDDDIVCLVKDFESHRGS